MKMIKNQSFQDHHIPPKQKLIIPSPLKTPAPSKSKNLPKTLMSRPQHYSKMEIVKNQVLLKPPNPPKEENIQKQSFEDCHTLPKWKLFKISPYKTTKPFQNKNCPKSVFLDHHILPNWKLLKISLIIRQPYPPKLKWTIFIPFETTTSSKVNTVWILFLQNPSPPSKIKFQ